MLVRSALHRDARKLPLAREVENIIRRQSLAFNGVWYDPSDFSSLFQDAAGTTPVTAVEQPVGKILDKSGRGNHATQSTAGYKPVLSARVNMLLASENMADPVWPKTQLTVSGTDLLIPTTVNTTHYIYGNYSGTLKVGRYSYKGRFTAAGYSRIQWYVNNSASAQVRLILNIGAKTGSVTTSGAIYSNPQFTIADAPGGALDVDLTFDVVAESGVSATAMLLVDNSGASSFAGDGVSGVKVSRVDFRAVNTGAGLPSYQRVNTASDYDTIGFPKYLAFDGLDDFLVTGNVDFSSSDKIAVSAGVRKMSDAATGMIFELSNSATANSGAFYLSAPNSNGGNNSYFVARGTGTGSALISDLISPVTRTLSGMASIAADRIEIFSNGISAGTAPKDMGTGNFGNYPLYIGRRAGTSLPFNGRLYGLAICGGMDDIYKLKKIEQYLAKKTGVII